MADMTNIFWEIWEILVSEYPDIADEYCSENDDFYFFRNEIQCKSEFEINELIIDVLKSINEKQTFNKL